MPISKPVDRNATNEAVQGSAMHGLTPYAFTPKQVKAAYEALGKAVRKASKVEGGEESALHGLTTVTIAFSMLLDVYARPNELNAEGMCDDPGAFREHFADILVAAPTFDPPLSNSSNSHEAEPANGQQGGK